MEPTTRGATPVAGPDRNRRKGLLWLALLGLLLLAVLAAVFIARRDKNDDTTSGTKRTTTTSPKATSAPVTTPTTTGGSDSSAPSSSVDPGESTTSSGTSGSAGSSTTTGPTTGDAPSARGTVMSGTTSLLPLPSAGLTSFAGKDAKGVAAPVESVVADEGFWVGSSPTNRLFVHLDVASESRQQVRAGQRVSFAGTVQKLSGDPARLGLEPGEGATLLKQQGAYVVANDLRVDS